MRSQTAGQAQQPSDAGCHPRRGCGRRAWLRAALGCGAIGFLSMLVTPVCADPQVLTFPRPAASSAVTAATAADLTRLAPATQSDSLVNDLDHVAFGRVVAAFDNFSLVPQWRDLLRRAAVEDALCRATCGSAAWRQLVGALRGLDRAQQIDRVQQRLNQLPYRDDLANWHRLDYWATPSEFLRKGGDCEDYAIAKYFALRAVGWPPADLRVMLSHRRGDSTGHAYLIVRSAGGWLVLDNQALTAYQPNGPIDGLWAGYSLNETSLWIHRNSAAPDFIVSSRQ